MTLTCAAKDVLAERRRQIEVEGNLPMMDDRYVDGEMGKAAACYAHPFNAEPRPAPSAWPWGAMWWKPSTYRRNLVKAGALILAEIERIDRAAQRDDETEGR